MQPTFEDVSSKIFGLELPDGNAKLALMDGIVFASYPKDFMQAVTDFVSEAMSEGGPRMAVVDCKFVGEDFGRPIVIFYLLPLASGDNNGENTQSQHQS